MLAVHARASIIFIAYGRVNRNQYLLLAYLKVKQGLKQISGHRSCLGISAFTKEVGLSVCAQKASMQSKQIAVAVLVLTLTIMSNGVLEQQSSILGA